MTRRSDAPSSRADPIGCYNDRMAINLEKLALVRSISAALAEQELADVNLLLHAVGLDDLPYNAWHDDRWEPTHADRTNAVLGTIRDLPRASIDDLSEGVRQLFDATVDIRMQDEPEPLRLFASHLATQKSIVGAVGDELGRWGIELFVAHDSIEPDLEWQSEIERSLKTCHGGVIFLMPGFGESKWCDQEVGWLLGREVPCYALKFQGQDPYGPLGKKQAFTVHDGTTAQDLAAEVVSWVATKPELTMNVNGSLVEALKNSRSYSRTDKVWAKLYAARDLTTKQVAGLLTAIRDNDQVYNAAGGVEEDFGQYAELAFKLALDQPGFQANEELAREVAKIRDLGCLLPDGMAATSEDEPPF